MDRCSVTAKICFRLLAILIFNHLQSTLSLNVQISPFGPAWPRLSEGFIDEFIELGVDAVERSAKPERQDCVRLSTELSVKPSGVFRIREITPSESKIMASISSRTLAPVPVRSSAIACGMHVLTLEEERACFAIAMRHPVLRNDERHVRCRYPWQGGSRLFGHDLIAMPVNQTAGHRREYESRRRMAEQSAQFPPCFPFKFQGKQPPFQRR